MRMTPLTELQARCQQFQKLLQNNDIEAALLVQNSDLFYFTGAIQKGFCYIPATGEPVYLVSRNLARARMESGLRQIVSLDNPKQLPELLSELGVGPLKTLGMELDVLPVLHYQRYAKLFAESRIVDISPLVRQVRARKSPYELAIMKDAASIADKVYEHAQTLIRAGQTDLEVAADLEAFARKEGHQGTLRFRGFNAETHFGHVLSGSDGAVPSFLDAPLGGLGVNPAVAQGASYKTLAMNEPIIIDFVIAFDGYLVDQTRTLSLGPLDEELQRAYRGMQKVQQHLCEIARPGVSCAEIYRQSCALAADLGYADQFMGSPGARVSFVGHGIGIEVDEYPFLACGFEDQTLEEGMTFAFEPKAVFPGVGAVGIENTWQVTTEGITRLTFADESLIEL